jgi:alkylhydroperoxidase family enzyme
LQPADYWAGRVSRKLPPLLVIADKVRQGGRNVTDEDIARARQEGADDRAIHDTVLIAAAFCMFNRYVDGLATWAPADPTAYDRMGAHLAQKGYSNGRS